MYCSKCNKKLKKDAKYCGECGAKVEKNLKLDKKIIALISVIVVVICILLFLKITTSPKYVANRYISAVINNNSNVLYDYLDLSGDKTFITKKIYKKLNDTNKTESKIENYKVIDLSYGPSKLNAKVRFSYTIKGSSNENNRVITLNKDKDKKYLFFNKWNISEFNKSSLIVEDYKIIVPKDSKVMYENILVKDKYLDKLLSTDKIDVYVLPQVFKSKANIEITLKNGLKVKDEIKPNSWSKQYKFRITNTSLSNKDKKEITKSAKKYLELIYNSAIEDKSFDDIKSNFKAKDLSKLEKNYTSFSKELNSQISVKLTNISFDELEISSASIDNEGDLYTLIKAKTTYLIDLPLADLEKAIEPVTTITNFILIFDINSKNYDLTDIKGFKTFVKGGM